MKKIFINVAKKLFKFKKRVTKIYYHYKYPINIYVPLTIKNPDNLLFYNSGWKGLELIIEDILNRFEIERNSCIEFGVEFGYSSVVFSNFFKTVKGVDTFEGDFHTSHKGNHFEITKNSLVKYSNIILIRSTYQNWISQDNDFYDFAHVDIVHNYKETFECGLWAVQHSKCCIFHDTEKFPEVRRAVYDIAKITGKKVFNYPHCYGLGIVV